MKMFEAPKWDQRYAADGYVFGTEAAAFLTSQSDLCVAEQTALVVADGEGRNSVFLAQQGMTVTTMDISAVGAAKSRKLAAERGVSVDVQVADILEWEWAPESFDLVVAIFIQFLDPQQRARAFEGMKRTLRPGGRILLHGYRPEQVANKTGGPPTPEPMYTEELLSEAFADFRIERLESYDVEIDEGTGHVGMSALIDMVAQKPDALAE